MKDKFEIKGITVDSSPAQPFDERNIEFLSRLSQLIMHDSGARKYENLAAFGFWCRRTRLLAMKKEHEDGMLRLGVGLVFHIAPSNVPLMFAYSMVIAMLAGNSNIIRVSSRDRAEDELLIDIINNMLSKEEFSWMRHRLFIVSYERDSGDSEKYSAVCDARIVWGGDETVNTFRAIPIPPYARELYFPDRWSLALLSLKAVSECSGNELESLVHGFYNDTLLMDQNACSSPKLVCWDSSDFSGYSAIVKDRFWNAFAKEAELKYPVDAFRAARKYEAFCFEAMGKPGSIKELKRYCGNLLFVADIAVMPENSSLPDGRFGLFYQFETDSMDTILSLAGQKVQTLVYYGTDALKLAQELIKSGSQGIDRIVPVGQAMEMESVWDGKDLISYLSRIIRVTAK